LSGRHILTSPSQGHTTASARLCALADRPGIEHVIAGRLAFTLIELLVVIGIITVLVGIMLVVISKAQSSAGKIHCLGNLRQITTAFHLYAGENHGRFPDPAVSNTSWEATLQRFLSSSKVFVCPSDSELAPVNGSSYDWRDTGNMQTTLAGKVMVDAQWNVVLTLEALPGWHQSQKMNVARIDGSCEELDDQVAIADLLKPIHK